MWIDLFLFRIRQYIDRLVVPVLFLCMLRYTPPSWFWRKHNHFRDFYGWAYPILLSKYRNIRARIKEMCLLRISLDDAISMAWDAVEGTKFERTFVHMSSMDRKYWFFYSMLAYGSFSGIRFYGARSPSMTVRMIVGNQRRRLHPYGTNRTLVYRTGIANDIYTDICISHMDFRRYVKQLKQSARGFR